MSVAGTLFSPYQSNETFRQDVNPTTKGFDDRSVSRYWGAQLTTSQPNPLERLNYNARNYPDMFRNRRLQLEDSLEGFILNGFEFYTYIIPWLITNEKSVKMNVYRHNVRPATITPNKGTSRQQSHQVSSKEATVERYGASFYLEGDLMGTPEGDRQYIRNLMGMAQGCQLTVNMETMTQLIDCKNYVAEWMEYRGRRSWVEDVMEMEVARFAGMAADANFLDQVVQQSISAFKLRSIVPDAIIGWDTMPFVESMINATKTGFWQMGPQGRDIFVAGPDGVTSIKGLPVFLSRPFTLNEENGPTQFLARDTTIGERYPMSWNDRLEEKFGIGGSIYHSDQREIRVWDLPTDAMKPITLRQALLNCRIWDVKTGTYSEELKKAVAEFNQRSATEGGFSGYQRYDNPAALDVDPAAVRTQDNAFFAFDVPSRMAFLPQFIGQFSTDVIKTSALKQMAEQLLMAAFLADRTTIESRVSAAKEAVKRWEDEAFDSNSFYGALAAANVVRSIDNTGAWVGERLSADAPRDWAQNTKGSLDLPTYAPTYGTFPPGFANYYGFDVVKSNKTWPAEAVNIAASVNTTVDQVKNQLTRVGKNSRLAVANAVPEWFHVKKLEQVVWEILFGARAPTFLAAPSGATRAAAKGTATPGGDGVKSTPAGVVPKYTRYPGNYAFVGTLPVAALLAVLVGDVANDAGARDKVADIFNTVVVPLGGAPTDEERKTNGESERKRTAIAQAIVERFAHYSKTDAKKYRAVYFIREVINALDLDNYAGMNDAYRAKFFALTDTFPARLVRKDIEKKEKEYDASYARDSASAATKADIDAKAEKIHNRGIGDVEQVAPDDKDAAQLVIGKKAELTRALKTAPSTDQKSAMVELADAIESVEKFGRRYGGFSWSSLSQWGNGIVNRATEADIEEFSSAIDSYNSASARFDQAVTTVFATGPPMLHQEESDDEGGGAVHGFSDADDPAARWFFRSPLSMTRKMLYASADQKGSLIQPADPATGFRTIFYPHRNPNAGYFAEDPILSMGQMPHMVDIGDELQRGFDHASVVRQHINFPAVQERGVDSYVAPAEFRAEAARVGKTRGAQKRSASNAFGATGARSATDGAAAAAAQKRRTATAAVPTMSAMDSVHAAMLRSMARTRPAGADADDDVDDKPARVAQSFAATGPHIGADGGMVTDDYDDSVAYAEATQSNAYVRMKMGKTMEFHWAHAAGETDMMRLARLWILMSDASSLATWLELIDNNILVPFNFEILRPQMTFSMYSLIVMRAGRDTGVNIIGDRNFAMQDQVVDKVAMGHLTFYYKCIIWRPQNIDHLRDIYPQKYRRGVDLTWIASSDNFGLKKNAQGSLMSWIYPLGENISKAAMSMIPSDAARAQPLLTNLPDTSLAAVLSTADFYARYVWKIPLAQTAYTQEIATFKKQRQLLNVVCFTGKYVAWDKSKKQFVQMTEGTGHLRGNKSGPTTAAVWLGQSSTMFPAKVICA